MTIRHFLQKIKVGDLVLFERVPYEFAESQKIHGIVIQLSKTGKDTESALVVWGADKNESSWIDSCALRIISESR